MKNYKEYEKEYIGCSDIAALTVTGCTPNGVSCQMLCFGADDAYDAYIVNSKAKVGSHYRKIMEFTHWVRIYDDFNLVFKVYARAIEIYRAGEYGCVIKVIGRRKEDGTYEDD